jgi:glycosyltransferase involved in cell wall biosynthesis
MIRPSDQCKPGHRLPESEAKRADLMASIPTLTVVSRSFPPIVTGSSILLANLLADYRGKLSAIVGSNPYAKQDPQFTAPCETHSVTWPQYFQKPAEKLYRNWPGILCRLLYPRILRKLKELRTSVVLASCPRADFFVATFLAARTLRIPFYAHMHDTWLEQLASDTNMKGFATKWEPIILKEATRVLCMTEAMQEHYIKKYSISTQLLPHTIPQREFCDASDRLRAPAMSNITALFVGRVDESFNLDSLKVLAEASELLPKGYELLFCTPTDPNQIHRLGIRSSRLRIIYVSRSEVRRLQASAHVLVAPLSHKNCSIDEVRTVFSTKLLEYLIAGRPIVVFAPKDSYHARSAHNKGWGYVVTEDSTTALAAAVVKVATDETLADRLVRAALREAHCRSARVHAEHLRAWVHADSHKYS